MYIHIRSYICPLLYIEFEDLNLRHYKERFSEEDVEEAFQYLLHKLEAFWDGVDIGVLKKACNRDVRLTNDLKTKLENVTDLNILFNILSNSPFCTWLDIKILKCMANLAEIPEAKELIKIFEECVHNRKCSEVELYFREQYINPDHLATVIAKLNENAKHLVVADLIKHCNKLETILRLPAGSTTLINDKEGCLEICFVIPIYCYLHAYEMAKNKFFMFRSIHVQYLQIGTFDKIYTLNLAEAETAKHFFRRISSFSNCKLHAYIHMYIMSICTGVYTYVRTYYLIEL